MTYGVLVITRPLRIGDAAEMAEVLRRNRDFLAPWDPVRDEDYFTEPGQRIVIEGLLDGQRQGSALPLAIVHNGAIVGRITLTAIARGPFQSCHLGYWVAAEANGRGLATAAVGEISRTAFGELGLHRIEAGTLLHNKASQRVLERNGFERIGTAPKYLQIAGRWQDHALFQLING